MPSTLSKSDRRQIASEFKERKTPRGIFAIRCSTTSELWVGSSPNLDATQNSAWFQLRGGQHRSPSLQATWKQHGEAAFSLDVLEKFDEEISPLLLQDLYTAGKKAWAEKLHAQTL